MCGGMGAANIRRAFIDQAHFAFFSLFPKRRVKIHLIRLDFSALNVVVKSQSQPKKHNENKNKRTTTKTDVTKLQVSMYYANHIIWIRYDYIYGMRTANMPNGNANKLLFVWFWFA